MENNFRKNVVVIDKFRVDISYCVDIGEFELCLYLLLLFLFYIGYVVI